MPVKSNPDVAVLITGGEAYQGRQGVTVWSGVSAENAGSTNLCLHRIVIPPGGRARAHIHTEHETAIYLQSGEGVVFSGEDLKRKHHMKPGDFMYIPAGVPHLPINLSATEPLVGLIARTDPNEQESVVLTPHLDSLPHVLEVQPV